MADPRYPFVSMNANYGDLQSVDITIQAANELQVGAPEGADLDSITDLVKTYLEGLTGVTSVTGYRNDPPVQTAI